MWAIFLALAKVECSFLIHSFLIVEGGAVCQKAGSDITRVRWLICFLYQRMVDRVLVMDVSTSELKTKVLPSALVIFDLVTGVPNALPYPKKADGSMSRDHTWIVSSALNPMWLASKPWEADPSLGTQMDLLPSCRQAVNWFGVLYTGEDESTVREMAENTKTWSFMQKWGYDRLNGIKDSLLAQWEMDIAVKEPVTHVVPEPTPTDATDMADPVAQEFAERDAQLAAMSGGAGPDKEALIAAHYDKHSVACMEDNLRWALRPFSKPQWVDLFRQHAFVVNRRNVTVWAFDPDLEREPQPSDKQSAQTCHTMIDTVLAENFIFAMEEICGANRDDSLTDILMLSDGRHPRNLTLCSKMVNR